MSDDFIPPSFFEGGEPQSEIAPGDPLRELLHEVRNLETGIELLKEIFQQLLPALEALDSLSTKLNTIADEGSTREANESTG